MGDGRLLVALVKELRDTIRELESLPVGGEESSVAKLRSRVTATRDELAARRADRSAGAASS
jgi:hypothetical protein